MKLYQKTQYGKFLIIIFTVITLLIFLATYLQFGTKPIPNTIGYLLASIFIICLIIFHKLTITITDSKIEAKFGLGLIKQTFNLNDLSNATIEKVKISALYGIGIRYTPHGTLYNVKLGEAIKIKSGLKTFLVGTDDYQELENILNNIKQKSS